MDIVSPDVRNLLKLSSRRTATCWCLEPSDYVERVDFRVAVSTKVDRVLTHFSDDETAPTWATTRMLADAQVFFRPTEAAGSRISRTKWSAAKIEFSEIDGVRLGFVNTTFAVQGLALARPESARLGRTRAGLAIAGGRAGSGLFYLWAGTP